jgi:hypothetical protein
MPRHPPLALTAAVAVAALGLLVAGCGGKSSPRVASVASSTTAATANQSGLIAYSTCMRAHGVSGFPDPDTTGQIPKTQVIAAAHNNLARFNSASGACGHLLPANGSLGQQETPQQQHTRRADGLSFAKCMRSHGVSHFPDPTAQGELTTEMVQAQGIDIHSPTVLRTVQQCLPASHGALTPAKIREALQKANG